MPERRKDIYWSWDIPWWRYQTSAAGKVVPLSWKQMFLDRIKIVGRCGRRESFSTETSFLISVVTDSLETWICLLAFASLDCAQCSLVAFNRTCWRQSSGQIEIIRALHCAAADKIRQIVTGAADTILANPFQGTWYKFMFHLFNSFGRENHQVSKKNHKVSTYFWF